jgi:hypothetical protein
VEEEFGKLVWSHPMDGTQLRRLKPELDTFLNRYLPLFGREENHPHAQRFVQGLLGTQERRNAENIAEVIGGASFAPYRSLSLKEHGRIPTSSENCAHT